MVQAPISLSAPDAKVQTTIVEDCQAATFKALSVSFDITNEQFSERFLPWVRLACVWLQRDHVGVEALVRDMVRQGGEVKLDEADRAWTDCAETFGTLREFVEAARVRLAVARPPRG